MGSALYPIRHGVLQSNLARLREKHACGARGGLRAVAEHCMQEANLIVPALRPGKLHVHRAKSCRELHPGYCPQDAPHDHAHWQSVFGFCRGVESFQALGDLLLQFRFVVNPHCDVQNH